MLFTALLSAGGLIAGLGGLWVAALFVPTLATLIKAVLDFARSPIGTVLAIVALVVFAFVSAWIGGDVHGTSATKTEWRADIAARAKAAAEREQALRIEMKAHADQVLAADVPFNKHIDDEVASYVAAKNPRRPECRATDDDIRRLLSVQ